MVTIDDAIYDYFMNLENEKQRDIAMIQRLMNRVSELENLNRRLRND